MEPVPRRALADDGLSLAVDPGTHTVYVTNLGLGFNSVSVIESR
jgi:DNA-binding beta-propeller fold protein YncE